MPNLAVYNTTIASAVYDIISGTIAIGFLNDESITTTSSLSCRLLNGQPHVPNPAEPLHTSGPRLDDNVMR